MFIEPRTYYTISSDLPVRTYGKVSKAIDWSKEWPESTGCLCWNCAHAFDTKPLPFPLSYDWKLDLFKVTGVFCSWNCIKAYYRDSRSHSSSGVDSMHITLFYKRCTGKIDSIIAAPPRYCLEAFGGHMTIEEFRQKGRDKVVYSILPPKMILKSQVVHEHRLEEERERRKVEDLSAVVDMSSSSMAGEPKRSELKLRRPKPVNARKQSLFEKIVVASESVVKTR